MLKHNFLKKIMKFLMKMYVTFHIKDDKEIVVDKVGLVDWPLKYSCYMYLY